MAKKMPTLTYDVQVIESSAVTATSATDIANDATVVGNAVFSDGKSLAFSYRKKKINRLTELEGSTSSEATCISPAGARIVGNCYVLSGNPDDPGSSQPVQVVSTACVFKGTAVRSLGRPPFSESIGSYVSGISDNGTAVGTPQYPDAHTSLDSRGALWDLSGQFSDVNDVIGFGSEGRIMGVGLVNESGDLQLFGMLGQYGTIAIYLAKSQRIVSVDLVNFSPYGMNNQAHLAGQSFSPQHALLWSPDGVAKDLGTLGGRRSCARDINDAGLAVGWSDTKRGIRHAFLYGRKITDLNAMLSNAPAGIILEEAVAINATNQIAANGTLNGKTRAFLLIPHVAH